jgi:hypothetical protein
LDDKVSNLVALSPEDIIMLKERSQACIELKAKKKMVELHLKIMKEVAETRSAIDVQGRGGNGAVGMSSPTKKLVASPRTPKPGQLRSIVGETQSPLHSLLLGRFSPLSLSRSTML